jgi:ferric iron reductase protein FhuF
LTPEAALRAAARLGPYFAWDPGPAGDGFRPLRDLLDPEVVTDRVALGRRTLARLGGLAEEEIPQRPAASIIFLGLASRLLSPPLAAACVAGAVPVSDMDLMWWKPVDAGPLPISYRDVGGIPCADRDPAYVAAELTHTAVHGLVAPILEVFRTRFRLSPQVVWGNVASTLGGALTMIAQSAPTHTARAAAVVEAMLDTPPLKGAADLVRPGPATERWSLKRRNCCLYYRIPGGGYCGDCVLTSARK